MTQPTPIARKPPSVPKPVRTGTGNVTSGPGPGTPKEVALIRQQDCHLSSQKVRSFFLIAPADSVPRDFHMQPEPLALVARELTMYADVRIVHPAGLWLADAIVVDHLPPTFAMLQIVRSFNMPPRKSDESDRVPAGYSIRQGDANEEPWIVMRDADEVCLSFGQFLKTKNQAVEFLLAHPSLRLPERSTVYG